MTNNINDLLSKLPVDSIAARLGEDPAKVREAAGQVLPALLAGMGANAQDPAGRDSLATAVDAHNPNLVEGEINVDDIDTQDGAKIAHHVFGQNEDQVAHQLGGVVGGTSLVRSLLPILAPIAMSWLAGRLQQGGGGGTTQAQSRGGLLEQILGQVLGGGQAQAPSQGGMGGVLGDILGGLLGGGRR
ncbi:MAG: DUF937 domain-containing protein [Corynebacterium sp.]|nr:DUF937 domain-containing protein [Corynebacterium sp.]MDO5512932.1 DUF937 domain-containing protein [Corynebacterium sp.]